MKKLIVLVSTIFLVSSAFAQNTKNHPGVFNKVSKQKEISLPGLNSNFLNFHIQNKLTKKQPHLKEANEFKQRLDSVVDTGSDKDVYVYDANGNVLQDTYFDWDGSQWVQSWKNEYTYDLKGNLVQNISSEWDGIHWVNLGKTEFGYDLNGNLLKRINAEWDGSNWVNSYKTESTYNNENNLTQVIIYYGNEAPVDTMSIVMKTDFFYDLSGNQTQKISYYWYNNIWENYTKTESVFDEKDKNTQILIYGWEGENWINYDRYDFVFDTNGNITQYISFDWNSIEWLEAAKYVYEYDANGNNTYRELIYFFDDQSITYSKEESVYDDFSNRILYSYFELDFENEELPIIPIWREEYVYDNNFSFEDLILPFTSVNYETDTDFEFGDESALDFNLLFKHKLTNIKYYDGEGGNWVKWADYDVYYSEQNVTAINGLNLTGNVNVYPNPATNQVAFNIDASDNQFTVEFYDIQGKQLFSRVSTNNRPISIESLNEGLYFYRLVNNENFYTGKIMVK